jgi:hypothetical protein
MEEIIIAPQTTQQIILCFNPFRIRVCLRHNIKFLTKERTLLFPMKMKRTKENTETKFIILCQQREQYHLIIITGMIKEIQKIQK